jgi:hypothetical protein
VQGAASACKAFASDTFKRSYLQTICTTHTGTFQRKKGRTCLACTWRLRPRRSSRLPVRLVLDAFKNYMQE